MGFAPVIKKTTCSRKKGLAKKKMTHGWPKAMNGRIPTDNQWLVHMWHINVPSVCIVQYLLFLDSIYQ
jgi:hypothetical protein